VKCWKVLVTAFFRGRLSPKSRFTLQDSKRRLDQASLYISEISRPARRLSASLGPFYLYFLTREEEK